MDEAHLSELLYWFYTAHYLEGLDVKESIRSASDEVGLPPAKALKYLLSSRRVQKVLGEYELVYHTDDDEEDEEEVLDEETMIELLVQKAGLKGADLNKALSAVFRIPLDRAEKLALRLSAGKS